jgi:amino acid permease
MWRWVLATGFLTAFCTGVGFITHPYTFKHVGFVPSLIGVILTGIYLLITGFYYLEAILASPKGANVFTISQRYLGTFAARIIAVFFPIVYYGYLIIFFFLSLPILTELFLQFGIYLPEWSVTMLLLLVLGGALAIGLQTTLWVSFVFLSITGIIFYIALSEGFKKALPMPEITFSWGFMFLVIPTLVDAIYYQTILPTLAAFLNYDRRKLRTCIVVSLVISLLLFVSWLMVVLRTVGNANVEAISQLKVESINFNELTAIPVVGYWIPYLLILEVIVTTLGIGALLVDFFSDLFRIPQEERKGTIRLGLSALIYIPCLVLSLFHFKQLFRFILFMTDLGALFFSGLFPVILMWKLHNELREKKGIQISNRKVFVLSIMTMLAIFIFYLFGLEIVYQRAIA